MLTPLQTEESSMHDVAKARRPASNPMEQGEVDGLETHAENQGRLVDLDKASGAEAHPGFGHVQSGNRQ